MTALGRLLAWVPPPSDYSNANTTTLILVYGSILIFFLVVFPAIMHGWGYPKDVWRKAGSNKSTYMLLMTIGSLALLVPGVVTAIIYFARTRKRLDIVKQGRSN